MKQTRNLKENKDQTIENCFRIEGRLLTGIFGGEVDVVGARVSGWLCHCDGANRNSGLCGHTMDG
jgi:hypothetical protein